MKKTTITVKDSTANKLNKLKYKLGLKTVGEVIDKFIVLIRKYKLEKELEVVNDDN